MAVKWWGNGVNFRQILKEVLCVCVCLHIHTYIYIYMCVCIYVHTYIHTHTHHLLKGYWAEL